MMKQRRHYTTHRLSRDAERLVRLAKGLADSGSRAEDSWWENELTTQINKMLLAGQEDALNQALDRLHETHGRAYDSLADLIEAGAESPAPNRLLIALPVLAWSRFRIPDRKLPAALLANLRVQLQAHILAEEVRVGLADTLFSPDQLPRGFVETHRFAGQLGESAEAGQDFVVPPNSLPETGHYIADLRYVLAAVVAPAGRPLFRWQEVDGSRETALKEWQAQAGPSIQAAMPGCTTQALLPDAYFSAWRQADQAARGYSLAATAAYLQATLKLASTSAIEAVAAPYYDHRLVEWRIGFSKAGDEQILHGLVWPLLGAEDESADIAGEIEATLKQAGLTRVQILDQRMPLDYCEDCGAPLFPNTDGESVHAEMPETESDSAPMHLH